MWCEHFSPTAALKRVKTAVLNVSVSIPNTYIPLLGIRCKPSARHLSEILHFWQHLLQRVYALRTFALIVCAQPFCAGNATVICHASLRLTGPEDKHGVENAWEKKFRPSLLLWIIGDPYFFNRESLTLLTIYKI